jgi:hypothetical protein
MIKMNIIIKPKPICQNHSLTPFFLGRDMSNINQVKDNRYHSRIDEKSPEDETKSSLITSYADSQAANRKIAIKEL